METEALLKGKVFQNLTPPSLKIFVPMIQKIVGSYFPEGDPRFVVSTLTSDKLLLRMRDLRKEIMIEPSVLEAFIPVWSELGFDLQEIYLDALRIRCVPDKFHEKESMASVGYIHRDPWYANPQCQMNFWIPIYEVEKGAGFRIYPSYFDKAIKNDSGSFDYSEWLSLGGFQSNLVLQDKKQVFPSPQEKVSESQPIDIYGREEELIAFSAHHLHGSSPNLSGKARFTLEVRFLLLSHMEKKLGPRKIDNFSKGSTLIHMYDLFQKKPVPETLIKQYEGEFVF